MKSYSPERKELIKDFSEKFFERYYRRPYISEIAEATGLSKSTVHRYLNVMNEEGMLRYDGDAILTDKIEKINSAFVTTGICGVIPCGSPTEQEEFIEEYVPLPVALFGEGDFFILRASGESMIEAGIDDGDLVLIRKDAEAHEGDIVAALVDNHESTLKTLYKDPAGECIILHPENHTMEDIRVKDCVIQGVAVNVIKSLNRH